MRTSVSPLSTIHYPLSPPHTGFSLIELLVVITIIAILAAMLLPAVQSSREAARQIQCRSRLRQIALGMRNYMATKEQFPPGAITWIGEYIGKRDGPGDFYDDHGWYSQMGPFIGEQRWYDSIDFDISFSHEDNNGPRRHMMPLFACPSDGLKRNEWLSNTWARVRGNYVVNFGNTNYGQTAKDGIPFLGAPFSYHASSPEAGIRDGLSDTLMMAEILTIDEATIQGHGDWGSPVSDFSTSLGGQTFNGWLTPNSPAGDDVARLNINVMPWDGLRNGNPRCNFLAGNGAEMTLLQSFAARSHHPGGVNAAMCDGSIHFFSDYIEWNVWQAMSTAQGGEPVDARP